MARRNSEPSKIVRRDSISTSNSWDNVYQEELANFEDIGDEGEIWYDDYDQCDLSHTNIAPSRFGIESVEKMAAWAQSNVPRSSQPSIIEIGSGNGTLLFALAESGYLATTLTGVDYSADAVNLANAISIKRGTIGITFMESDFLKDDLHKNNMWDLVLDKGTYDAIALGTKDEYGLSPAARYPAQLVKLMKPGAYFLITCAYIHLEAIPPSKTSVACNFTEDELKSAFATPETDLVYQQVNCFATYNGLLTVEQLAHTTPSVYVWWPKRKYMYQCSVPEARTNVTFMVISLARYDI